MWYRIGDSILRSSTPLLGLSDSKVLSSDEEGVEFDFSLRPAQKIVSGSYHWFHQWCFRDGRIWLAFAKERTHYLLRFPDLADFLVSLDGTQIHCCPVPETPLETVEHLLLDQVIPLVLNIRGKLVLHASGIVTPAGAAAFLGITGQGKSTLATTFSTQGYPILSDDYLVVEEKEGQLWGKPSYPGVRLWADSIQNLFERNPASSPVAHYTAKKRLSLNEGQLFCSEPATIRKMYFLAGNEQVENVKTVSFTPLSPREAFMELVSFAFKLDITDRDRLKTEFFTLGRLANLSIFYRLAYPRDFSLLPTVCETILDHLRAE